jgi:hypothetical protein
MKCKCNNTIPQGRLDLGYTTCIECSSVEAYGCVRISNHKTGNTIQVTSQATMRRMEKLGARRGYGVMSGMKHN